MPEEGTALTILATKPKGKLATLLADTGITILPLEEYEGNVDRYVLSKRVAIERWTGASFLRGVQENTLFTSAIYLREHFEIPILILEGQVDYVYTSFHPQAVRGALTAMMLNYGVSVLSTPDIAETAQLIAMAARQEQVGIPEISLTPKRKAANFPDLQRRVIEMLPGCGMVTAPDLLQFFGSMRRIANATEAEFRQVRGIGEKNATEMIRVLTAEYEDVGTEKDLEDAVEASPTLLFEGWVTLLARQHHIYTDRGERHIVDLVFQDPEANELILVELKLGKLLEEHYDQIRRYLDNAHESPLLRGHLEQGAGIRGILATIAESEFEPHDKDIVIRIVSKAQAIEVLKELRKRRFTPW